MLDLDLDGIGGYAVLRLIDGTLIAGLLEPNQKRSRVHIHAFVAGEDRPVSQFVNPSAVFYSEVVSEAQARAVARRHSRRPGWWPGPDGQPRWAARLRKSGLGVLLGCVVIAALGLGAMVAQRALDSWRLRPLVEAVRTTEAAPAARGPVGGQEAVVASQVVVSELPRQVLRVGFLSSRGESAARDIVAAVALDMRTPVAVPDAVYDAYFDRPGIGAAINRAQEEYGVSGLGLGGLVGHESARATSAIAREKNNWTGMGAGGDDPAANAYRYANPEECIDDTAGWLAVAYLSEDGQYYGGMSAEGVNQHYAGDRVYWTGGLTRHMLAILELAHQMGLGELRIAAAD